MSGPYEREWIPSYVYMTPWLEAKKAEDEQALANVRLEDA